MGVNRRHLVAESENLRGALARVHYDCGQRRDTRRDLIRQFEEDGVTTGWVICEKCYRGADESGRALLEEGMRDEEVEKARDAAAQPSSSTRQTGEQDFSAYQKILRMAKVGEVRPGRGDTAKRDYHEELLVRIVEAVGRPVKKGDVEKHYVAALSKEPDTHMYEPYTGRHVGNVLRDLVDRGELAARKVNYGRYGRTTLYALNEDDLYGLSTMRPPRPGEPMQREVR